MGYFHMCGDSVEGHCTPFTQDFIYQREIT